MKSIFIKIVNNFCKILIKYGYPQFKRPVGYGGTYTYWVIFKRYFIMQKILGFNRHVPWPVHFTSTVVGWKMIEKGICCDPGDNLGIYINASGGLKLGNNVGISHHSVIATVNHYKYDHRKQGYKKGVVIGNNVWIGSHCTILPGVTIGDNVTIGAGCVIRESVPSDIVVIPKSDFLEYIPKKKAYEWDCTKDKLL